MDEILREFNDHVDPGLEPDPNPDLDPNPNPGLDPNPNPWITFSARLIAFTNEWSIKLFDGS